MAADVKDIKKDLGELGQRVVTLEQASDSGEEELNVHQHEVLELCNKNEELQYYLEDLENRLCRFNIRIKGVPIQVDSGKLENYVIHLFRHVTPDLADKDVVLDHTHRAGRPAKSPGMPQDIPICLHHYRQKESIMSAARGQSLRKCRLSFARYYFKRIIDSFPFRLSSSQRSFQPLGFGSFARARSP
ncbi:hypothetical protein NDU88_003987 [Pleurodeles waltl]|uniref:Uncharacterized protein n=1 Tax=Pleurodeles waltl TaxID=8319 RepID=A0AAV7M501_PLEWA|nr:hypothetical protein NDU88_003987 [Pleurodeles waltl]